MLQNLSKIDLGGVLEATWEPPLCRGDPKTSFLMILAPFWDPIWGPVWDHVGHHFLTFFLIWFMGGVFVGVGSIWSLFWITFWDLFGFFCLQLYITRDMCNEHTWAILAAVLDLVVQGDGRHVVGVCLGSMYTRAHT